MRISTLLTVITASAIVNASPLPTEESAEVIAAQLDPSLACLMFKATFGGDKVFLPDTATYSTESRNYWSATNYATPACVFLPTSSSDISAGLKLALQVKTKLAVRGAGHLAAPDVSSVDAGILFAMTKFTQMELSDDQSTLQVGPGLRWEQVYEYLDPFGLVVVGGRIAPVGVPGLLLNGGVSFYNAQYGWACDNVINYEVVLPDGKIVQANSATNSDLFLALKGGSSNFGIVTKFTLKTYVSKGIWAGVHIVSEEHLDAYSAAIVEYTVSGAADTKSSIAPGYMSAAPGVTVGGAILFYDSEDVAYPDALKMFTDIPSISSNMGFKTMLQFAKELAAFAGTHNGSRQTFAVGSTLGGADSLDIIRSEFINTLPDLRAKVLSVSGTISITIQPITRAHIEASELAGGNALGLDKEKAPYFVHAHSIEWQSAEDDQLVYDHINSNLANIQTAATAINKYDEFKYLGDAMTGQKVMESYGNASMTQMQAVKLRTDPTNLWDDLLPGGFKILHPHGPATDCEVTCRSWWNKWRPSCWKHNSKFGN